MSLKNYKRSELQAEIDQRNNLDRVITVEDSSGFDCNHLTIHCRNESLFLQDGLREWVIEGDSLKNLKKMVDTLVLIR